MEKSSFFNAELKGEDYDRVYLAEDYARYFASFIGDGVFPNPTSNLQVISINNNMTLIVKSGKSWINGYFYENTDDLILNVGIADGVLNRIDRVVVRLDFINREIKTYIKRGTVSSQAVAPTLTRDADMYELGIADIRINKGVTKINQSDITDLRANNNFCGFVAGVVDQIDTTNLFEQFQNSFEIWFEHIRNQLTEDAAGNLQTQIDTWVEFKTNGGEIGGPILGTNGTSGHSLFEHIGVFNNRNAKLRTSTGNYNGYPAWTYAIDDLDDDSNSNGILYLLGNGKIGSKFKDNSFRPRKQGINDSKNKLGDESVGWDEVWLNGRSIAKNGYTKLPNGLILQWGSNIKNVVPNGSSLINFSFPVKFPNGILTQSAICHSDSTANSVAWTSAISCSMFIESLVSAVIEVRDVSFNLPKQLSFEIRWFVIGY